MRDYNRELTESELTEIARLRRKNYSYREISRLVGISLYRATILAKKWEKLSKEELEALRKENASRFWVNVERSPSLTAEHHEFLAKLRLIAQFDEQLKQFDKEKGAYLSGVALTEIRARLYEEIEDLEQELELIPSFVEFLVKFHELYPTKTLRGLFTTLGVKLE